MKDSKQIFRIVLINFIVFLCFLVLLEIGLWIKGAMNEGTFLEVLPRLRYKTKMVPFEKVYEQYKKNTLKKTYGENNKKPPIVLFGCSFAYGSGLEDNKTFAYKLAQKTKRPVYNRAFPGGSPSNMLYQLRRDDFYKEVKEPEYIVYLYYTMQFPRMYKMVFWEPSNDLTVRYQKNKNGGLDEIKTDYFYNKLWFLHTVRFFQEYLFETKIYALNRQKVNELLRLHFEESRKAALKHWPNSKFVILLYRDGADIPFFDQELFKTLQKEGFTVIDLNELTGVNLENLEYKLSESDHHPNEKAWDLVVPALSKKMNF